MSDLPGTSQDNDFPLPAYIHKREGGVFVSPSRIPIDNNMQVFVERLFSHGARFSGLDYGLLQRLLYDAASFVGQAGEVKLAAEIVVFPEMRKGLYKGVRVMDNGARAEYMFEPAFLEVIYQEPVYAEADEDGIAPITEYRQKIKTQPTSLDFDEFVADMWVKGVRFGLDVPAVQSAISANKTERVVIAIQREPVPGRDAELLEACEGLRRDDSPMIKASGKADLKRFKNRFPQISRGERMMQKIPRQLGEPGYKVTGELVEPAIPNDINLDALAGPGTKIELTGEGEYILAMADGFLSIDIESNQISVTEKIENKGGISAKTTGDLSLSVDEFVERGEVQEKRVVEGKHMTFSAAVYGALVSSGGNILLEDNLSGGSAKSPGGSITVKGRASSATLEAVNGKVNVSYAENCIIIGDEVTIEHAISCDIVAKRLHMTLAEGCSIAGLSIDIATSGARRDQETVVSILVPDPTDFDRQTSELKTEISQIQQNIDAKSGEMNMTKSDPDFAKFLALREMVRGGAVKLSPEQQQNLRQMIIKFTPAIKMLEKLGSEKQVLAQSLEAKEQLVAKLEHERLAGAAGRKCSIGEVVGHTHVQQLMTNLGAAYFDGLAGNELKSRLRKHGVVEQRIFSDDEGSVAWRYKMSEPSASTLLS